MEQQVLRFGWVVCGAAGLCRVLRCWSAVVAKLPCNCAMEIKWKNKYFHALIMLALLQIKSLSVIVTGPDHNAQHNLYILWLPRVKTKQSWISLLPVWGKLRDLKSKTKPTTPSSPPRPPLGAADSRGFLGNYTDNLLCSISGVLTQHRPCLVLSSSGWILLPCGDTGAGGKKREGEGEKPCRFHQSDRQQIEEGAEVV